MHYLQNSWFIQNGMWVFVFALAGVSVISYMHNRRLLMKRSLVALGLVFLMAFSCSALMSGRATSIPSESFALLSETDQDQKIESGSLWGNLLNYVSHLLVNRVKE